MCITCHSTDLISVNLSNRNSVANSHGIAIQSITLNLEQTVAELPFGRLLSNANGT